MRTIALQKIAGTVEGLCAAAAHELPEDVLRAIEQAAGKESDPTARDILKQLIENARIAADERIPLCQDTGLTVVFADQGVGTTVIDAETGEPALLDDAINAGVASGYENGYLRKSIVAEPLHERLNTGTNTPAVLHHRFAWGDRLR